MKNIYIDLDSTLCNFISGINNEINRILGLAIPIQDSDIISYDYYQKQFGEWVKSIWSSKGFYNNIIPFEGAVDFINILKLKYNVIIITSSAKQIELEKEQFVYKYFGNLEVIHSHNKYEYTKNSILIDDYIKNIAEHTFRNDSPGILFNFKNRYPYADINYNNLSENLKEYLKINKTYYSDSYETCLEIIEGFK